MQERPYRVTDAGVVLFVRVTPNAGVDRVDGGELRDDGSAVLRVRVRAVPDKGRANQAVIVLLAKCLKVTKSDISVVAGETARLKRLAIVGSPPQLTAALDALI